MTGSDQAPNPLIRSLERDGIRVSIGHRAENVAGADLVLISSAVGPGNPEVQAARDGGVPVFRRTDFLGELTAGIRTVAVAGTHGKTTTSALIAWILKSAGRDPGYVLGGHSADMGGNGGAGSGGVFVIEADEYDRAFLGLHPSVGLVTNVEYDHPDLFPSVADYRASFEAFVDLVEDRLIVCREDPGALSLSPRGVERLTYGLTSEADWYAEEIRPNSAGGSDFLGFFRGTSLGLLRTRLPGRHNVLNVLAALAAVEAFEVAIADTRLALTGFSGVDRRFTVLGEAGGVTVIDDYAHHPTEVRATLSAVRTRFPGRRVVAVFQPHTFSRTRALAEEFSASFEDADRVVITGIFPAREAPAKGMDAAWLADRINHPAVRSAETLDHAARAVLEDLVSPAVVVTSVRGGRKPGGRAGAPGAPGRRERRHR